jgi:hypothetical protein
MILQCCGLWICIGFNSDPDPAFYLDGDPDLDPNPGSLTNAELDPGQTFKVTES